MTSLLRLASLLFVLTVPIVVEADLIEVDVSFVAPGHAEGFPDDPPEDPIAGAFSFQYSSEIFTGGIENFVFAPTSVALSIAGYIYSIGETGVLVRFEDQIITDILFGRILNGINGLNGSTNDFFFSNSISGNLFLGELTYSTLADGRIFKSDRGPMSVQTNSIPEPGTLALLGIGLFGMGLARRKKA